jgi:hypothetical protein
MTQKAQNLAAVFLITLMIAVSYSCKKDKDSTPSILGSWIMSIGPDKDIPIQISFFANDFFEWIPLIPTESHTRSAADYDYTNGVLTIMNDPDCPEAGTYDVSVEDDKLVISVIEDDCSPRITGLEGSWTRKNDLPERKIEGIWKRNISLEGEEREIVFYTQQNGVFEWIISEPTSVYETTNGRYAVGDEYLVIYNFLDCSGLGYYTYIYTSENRLLITENFEPCEIRSRVLTGTWAMD